MRNKIALLALTGLTVIVPVAASAKDYYAPQPTTVRIDGPDRDHRADVVIRDHDGFRDNRYHNDRYDNRRIVAVRLQEPRYVNRAGCGWGVKITKFANGDRISKDTYMCKAGRGEWRIAYR